MYLQIACKFKLLSLTSSEVVSLKPQRTLSVFQGWCRLGSFSGTLHDYSVSKMNEDIKQNAKKSQHEEQTKQLSVSTLSICHFMKLLHFFLGGVSAQSSSCLIKFSALSQRQPEQTGVLQTGPIALPDTGRA